MLQPKKTESTNPSIELHIKQWLKYRQTVLVQYSQLCSTETSTIRAVENFCQHLMDYLSFGHFKMFEKFAEHHQAKEKDLAAGLDGNLLNQISLTTDVALDFNEKYTKPKDLENLSHDLSHLGQNLAHRMDWEDQLIKNYSNFYTKH